MQKMRWLSEIRATRRSMAEIGLLIIVREIFKNRMEMTFDEANDTLGTDWAKTAKRLQSAGMLKVEHDGLNVRLWVAAPGDRKRERSKRLMARLRAMRKLEKNFADESAVRRQQTRRHG